MKTITYNPEREIVTALLALILSFSVLTTVKAQGNPGTQPTNETGKGINESNAVMPIFNDEAPTQTSEKLLILKIEYWMNNSSYWDNSSEKEFIIDNLASDIKEWMANGSFWSPDTEVINDADKQAMSQKELKFCDAFPGAGN